jgi:ureidoglycolate lyase
MTPITPNRRDLAAVALTLTATAPFAEAAGPAAIPPLNSENPFATRGAAPAERRPTHTTRRLQPITATAQNFAPFGVVLTETGRNRLPINTYGPTLDLYREGFESDQPIEWFIFQGRNRGTDVLFLERHQQLSQTFIPLGGRGFFTVLARPGAREENGLPALDELQAFWVPGDIAIQLHRATWHENPMPAEDGTRMLVTSHANITLAHQQNPDPALRALPLDLERRWYGHAGVALSVAR